MTASIAAPLPPAAPIARNERSLAPDVARGAMLLFIALANVGSHIWARPHDVYGHISDASILDRTLHFAEQLLVHERSRPMFAILYGFGLAMMTSRLVLRGADERGVRTILRRRSWSLMLLGAIHSVLLFAGDILAPYGATGLIVLFFVTRSDHTVRRWMWWTLAIVVLVSTPLYGYLISDAFNPVITESSTPELGATYGESAFIGAFATTGTVTLAVMFVFFVPQTLAGILLFRAGWLQSPGQYLSQLRRVFIIGMAVNVASSLPIALIALGAWEPPSWGFFSAVYLTLVGGLVAGLGYICGFALLAHRWRSRGRSGVPGALAALGARSLSGYLGQSIIMIPLLSPWGLRLGESLGYAGAFGVAFGAWLLTVLGAVWLDKRDLRGPFEVLLRRLTYRSPR